MKKLLHIGLAVHLWATAFHCESEEPRWQVSPSVCIGTSNDKACQMQVNISYYAMAEGEYCLVLNEQQLQCWPKSKLPKTYSITFETESVLYLNHTETAISLSHPLAVQYRQGAVKRRRIRNPWSLF